MRPDEEFAQRAFAEFLSRTGSEEVSWAPGDEPPDRYVTVDARRFAVEITQIMELVPLGTHSMPDHGVNEFLRRFAVSLEDEAKERGVLKGTYAVYLEPIPNFAAHREVLSEQVFHYLEATARDDSAQAATIGAFENHAMIHIEKFSSEGQHLHYMTGGADAKWPGQILHDLSTLIPSAVSLKAQRLSKFALPKILLLVDSYLYGKSEEWQAVINAIPQHPFHTIARVHNEHRCQILFSSDRRWYEAAA